MSFKVSISNYVSKWMVFIIQTYNDLFFQNVDINDCVMKINLLALSDERTVH